MVPKVKLLKIIRYFVYMFNLLFASGYDLARVFNIINTNIILVCSMYVWVFFFLLKVYVSMLWEKCYKHSYSFVI